MTGVQTCALPILPARTGGELLLASSDGRGFVAAMGDVIAETRKGKQVVNVRAEAKLAVVHPISPEADSVAVIGENRKLLVYSLTEMPRMARGQGVQIGRAHSELQSLMRISYAVFCLKKKTNHPQYTSY